MSGARRPSTFAAVNALFRHDEQTLPPSERLVDDPYAGYFRDRSWLVSSIRYLRHVVPPLGRLVEQLKTVHCVRHATVDALVLRALTAGVSQVVILGAGYDSRAERLGQRFPEVRWYEVDHLGTQTRKLQLLAAHGTPATPQLRTVAADLNADPTFDSLAARGLELTRPVCFVAEGLVHYLRADTVAALLAHIGATSTASLIVTYITPSMERRASGLHRQLFRVIREIPRLLFATDELEGSARRCGFERFSSWDYAAQVHDFCPQAATRLAGVSQSVALLEHAGA